MNKFFKHALQLSLVAVLATSCSIFKSSSEPEPFKGTISYSLDIEMDGENAMLEQIKAMMPSEVVMGSDGMNFGFMMNGEMQNTHMVANVEERMMYIASQGQYMKQPFPEESDSAAAEPEIVALDETKEVLGFMCKGYTITPEGGQALTLFVTEEINLTTPESISGGGSPFMAGGLINGTPLYMKQTIDQGMIAFDLIFEATNIVEGEEATTEVLTPEEGEYELMEG